MVEHEQTETYMNKRNIQNWKGSLEGTKAGRSKVSEVQENGLRVELALEGTTLRLRMERQKTTMNRKQAGRSKFSEVYENSLRGETVTRYRTEAETETGKE